MGEYGGPPAYPVAMSAVAQPTTGPARWHATRVAAAVLCFLGVVMVVSSAFLPLYGGELGFGRQAVEVTFTAWTAEISIEDVPDAALTVPRVGYPLVFSALFLAGAAVVCWFAASPASAPGTRRAAGVTTATGAAFLLGVAWTTAVVAANGVSSFLVFSTLGGEVDAEASYLVGYWLLLVAAGAVLVAAVLASLPVRVPGWVPPPPVHPDAPTPPYGVALPLPEPAPVTVVDPLTGLPLVPSPESPPGPVLGPLSPSAGVPLAYAPEPRAPLASPPSGLPLPPVVLPAAPPAPAAPPGPAIPAVEDPLAEPPRS